MATFLGSTFPGILCCMLFHDATAADLSALARERGRVAGKHIASNSSLLQRLGLLAA